MNYFKFFIFFLLLHINLLYAQNIKNYNMDSVVVTSNRTPTLFSGVGRSVIILKAKEISQLPVTTIQDLLEQISSIDIKQRGAAGIQADVSIRGATFEQTLILINGIELSDPQTGHHNMNLPVSLNQVERIEILKGQGANIHGANAFGGVINIITKKNAKNNIDIDFEGGENSFYKLGVNASGKFKNTNHFINFSKTKSDGYRFNTNFETYNFSVNNSINFSQTILNTFYGFVKKDFGANSFYTIKFPKQAEKTLTQLAYISADIQLNGFNIQPKIYWRGNDDEFVLDKFNPGFYKNNHTTNVYGSKLQVATNILGGTTSFGFDFTIDNIQSNNLGKHKRERKGFFIEQNFHLSNKITFNAGATLYNYSNFGWKLWPGLDISYSPNNRFKIFANYGKAFRIPTYTELFYSDPITKGNSNLQPEESGNYETGMFYKFNSLNFSFSLFRREGKNLIDFVKTGNGIWEAKNITKLNTTGIEFVLSKIFNHNLLSKAELEYTYLNNDKIKTNKISRYTLTNLKHDFNLKFFMNLPFNVKQSLTFGYEDRVNTEDHFIIDTKLTKEFGRFITSLKISNLLNKPYEEIPGVRLPGRWIIGGLKINLMD